MRLFKIMMLLFSFGSLFAKTKPNFLVCYGKFDIVKVKGYDLLIVEAAHFKYSDIQFLKKYNKKVVAYISLGEINENAKDFKFLKETTSGKNNDWNSHYLDLTAEKTVVVLNNRIKNIFFIGYDGLFLDNIDNFTSFGPMFNQQSNLIKFVKAVREVYPDKLLVQNAGLEIVNKTEEFVDCVLIESIVTGYDFNEKKYQLRSDAEIKQRLDVINQQFYNSKIPVLLLEYANKTKLKREVSKILKTTKYSFSISEITLQKIPD